MNEPLAAKVKAVNRANEYANDVAQVLAKFFQPYVGQTIIKADGSLLAKIEKKMPVFANNNSLVVLFRRGRDLDFEIKACENIVGTYQCVYHHAYITVGDMRGGELLSIRMPNVHRCDYTVEGVLAAGEAVREARSALSTAQGNLEPFGEHY